MHIAEVLAMAYRYPTPTAASNLAAAVDTLPQGAVRRHMSRFLTEIEGLSLGAWEELHTSTLDLSPQFVPYVGHVAWGENYRRGEFMADLNGSLREAGVDLLGELPDHIEPLLRYVATAESPQADLIEVLPSAVQTMEETLKSASPDNIYRHLLSATATFVADLRPLTIGRKR